MTQFLLVQFTGSCSLYRKVYGNGVQIYTEEIRKKPQIVTATAADRACGANRGCCHECHKLEPHTAMQPLLSGRPIFEIYFHLQRLQ